MAPPLENDSSTRNLHGAEHHVKAAVLALVEAWKALGLSHARVHRWHGVSDLRSSKVKCSMNTVEDTPTCLFWPP